MVEVFKTNVNSLDQARVVLEELQKVFLDYSVNFDLEDCDKILRVKCELGLVQNDLLICLLNDLGYEAEVLQDDSNHTGPDLTVVKQQESIIQ